MKFVWLSIIFLNISCCDTITPPSPVTKDIDYCKKAEDNLKKLGCIDSSGPYTKKGKSYSEFCTELQNKGIFTNPKCVASLNNCDDFKADTCNRDN
jgi:hypothetical protein